MKTAHFLSRLFFARFVKESRDNNKTADAQCVQNVTNRTRNC